MLVDLFLPIRFIMNLLAIHWMDVELRANLFTFFVYILILILLHLLSLRIVTYNHCASLPIRRWFSIHVDFGMVFAFFWWGCCYFFIFLILVLLLKYLFTLLMFYIFLLLIQSLCWYWLDVRIILLQSGNIFIRL